MIDETFFPMIRQFNNVNRIHLRQEEITKLSSSNKVLTQASVAKVIFISMKRKTNRSNNKSNFATY